MAEVLKYVGIGTSSANLIVYVDVEVNGVRHPHDIRVSWHELAQHQCLQHIDKAVRARMMAAWEGPDEIDRPLPGIG